MSNNEQFNFDNVSFDPVDMDELEVTHLTDDGDIDLNLNELNDHNDIPVSVHIAPKSAEQLAEAVEDVVLSLLESEEKPTLLLITGERPDLNIDIDEKVHSSFVSEYTQACMFNPAIKWYAKLANILQSGQFGVKDGQLFINIPKSVLEKMVLPFSGDFDRKFYETSPIVHLVLDCLENHSSKKLSASKEKFTQEKSREFDTDGLDLSMSDLDNMWDTDDVAAAGNMRVEDNNSLNQTEIKEVTASLRFADLSNKAIADYLLA
ncbi:MAG: hypothetical protein WC511_03265, partial [Candidatus Pacearchaeota archaeon]